VRRAWTAFARDAAELLAVGAAQPPQPDLFAAPGAAQPTPPHLAMPDHHDVRAGDESQPETVKA